ncbi:PilZ domain-containing protein [bacterium]|nr:PilZ domain-containing protein [bacterium]MBO5447605.1 PilZ domain-containing protein [bacterium]
MRELVVENQEILMIPQNFKFANRGKVTEVRAGDFTLELDYEPEGVLENTYCEFYTQTSHGKLYFDSYAKEINGKTLIIASPAKHKFLQRRQYTRIKYMNELELFLDGNSYKISTLDISAGGMKLKTDSNINIEGTFDVSLPLSDNLTLACKFQPIRIEKRNEGGFTISGQFVYNSSHDKMILTQYCAKRSVEIKNK